MGLAVVLIVKQMQEVQTTLLVRHLVNIYIFLDKLILTC